MRKTFLVMLTLLAVASAWAGDFDQPQKDCAPCLFSPGKGQPEFELRFRLSKDGSSLVALEVKASGGRATQVLTLREPADAGLFEGGFEVMTTDLDLDGYADLGIATVALPHGARLVEYWLYHPSTRTFVPLKRVGDNDGEGTNDYMLDADPQTRELHCTESANGEPDTYAEYWYRVDGDRAIAVRRIRQEISEDRTTLTRTTEDLTTTPPKVVRRQTGFADYDTEAFAAFRRALDAAARRATALWKQGDKQAAVEAFAKVLNGKIYDTAYGLAPVDRTLVAEMNDYGFYLEETGRYAEAVDVLTSVWNVDATRAVVYLNLADAQFALGRTADARPNYARYAELMTQAGKAAKIPPRVAERSK
jgi:hypothetical protein